MTLLIKRQNLSKSAVRLLRLNNILATFAWQLADNLDFQICDFWWETDQKGSYCNKIAGGLNAITPMESEWVACYYYFLRV